MLKYFGVLIILVTSTFGASLPKTFEEPELFKNDNRIVGGHEVNIYKNPHQVSIRLKAYDKAFRHFCGGSIYKANVIITAAHCVFKRKPNSFAIVAGTNNREGGDGAIALVSKIIMHEKYDSTNYNNDIALMILSPPLPLNNFTIAPIALAREVPKDGAKALVTGWGATIANGYSSDKLLEVEVRIINNERCDRYYAEAYDPGRISESMICAGIEGVGGKDACQGDSGGPLVVKNQLTGVVSWGLGCALAKYPGVYSNVPFLLDWIEAKARENAL